MKHKLSRTIQKGVAIVTTETMLFSFVAGCTKENKKFNSGNEVVVINLSEDDGLKHLQDSFYTEPETNSIGLINETRINYLLNKYFKDSEIPNIRIDELDIKSKKPKISVELKKIYNDHNLASFFIELNKFCDIAILKSDYKLLAQLNNVEFNSVDELIISNESNYVGLVDLSNFKGIHKLILNKINVINIPPVKEVYFNGFNHCQYFIGHEIESLQSYDGFVYIEINDVNISDINIPPIKNIYLKFNNCIGNINVCFTGSENVYIVNDNCDTYKNWIIVSGNITGMLYLVSNCSNIFTRNISGTQKSTLVIKFPEGDYIKKPDDIEILSRKLELK